MVLIKEGKPFEGEVNLDPAKVQQLYDDGIWTKEDLDKHGIEVAEPFVEPEGKVKVGEPSYIKDKEKWIEVYAVEDAPLPPPAPTPEEKLFSATGLTVAELKELLK